MPIFKLYRTQIKDVDFFLSEKKIKDVDSCIFM